MKTSEWDWFERFPHSGLSEDYYNHPLKQTPLRANNTFFLFKKICISSRVLIQNCIIIKLIVSALKSNWTSHIEPLNNKQYKYTHTNDQTSTESTLRRWLWNHLLLLHKAELQETIITHILAIIDWSKSWVPMCILSTLSAVNSIENY